MTPSDQSAFTRKLCRLAPVMPVLVVKDQSVGAELAHALIDGGLPVLEVTLRTPAALAVIRAMSGIAGAHVGAGTVLSPDDVKRAKEAGASFAVSPGATPALIAACEAEGLPLLPGAATASEIMALAEKGYDMMKFFPAEAAGGVKALKSLGGPLPGVSFCPTGGINAQNASEYLALANVVCVGGSWIVQDSDLSAGNFAAITALAQRAANL